MRRFSLLAAVGTLLLALAPIMYSQSGKETVLKPADITPALFPEKVFYRGKVTTTQLRNTGGVHFADDFYVLAGLADVSGYSSGIQEKFQGYLITEVPLEIGGHQLIPGSYGIGFSAAGQFVVTDLGGHDLFQTASAKDAKMPRPVPLQVTTAASPGTYRLYLGRNYVEFNRAPK